MASNKKQPNKKKDELKEELLKVYKDFKEVQTKSVKGMLHRHVMKKLKEVDTSNVEKLLKGEE